MQREYSFSRISGLFLGLLFLIAGSSAAQIPQQINYQGYLETSGGSPVNNTLTMTFRLYETAEGGTALWTETQNGIQVADGVFFARLGAVMPLTLAFDRQYYLGVSVASDAEMTPRQPLTSVGYAFRAANTEQIGALTVDKWCSSDGSEIVCSEEPPIRPARVVWVAQSGGDFSSIQAALDSIVDASASNPYLLMAAPGVYQEQVTMKPYVDIQGAGEGKTVIKWTGGGGVPWMTGTSGTVLGADHAGLRFLTVESDATGTTYATAIHNQDASPALIHVTANASGGSSYNHAIVNISSSPTMTYVIAAASGGSNSRTIYNYSSSSPIMTHVSATASGGTTNYGVQNHSSSPVMMHVTASAFGGTTTYGVHNYTSSSLTMKEVTATASGAITNYGVINQSSSYLTMEQVMVTVSGGNTSYGVYNLSSTFVTMAQMTVNASGATASYGVYNSGSSPTIRDCALKGATNSIYNLSLSSAKVANTLLDGSINAGGGLTCVGTYNASFTALNDSCQ